MSRCRAALFLALYIGAVLYLCLYPWTLLSPPHADRLIWIPLNTRRLQLDFVLNVLLYLPLGAAAYVVVDNGIFGLAGAGAIGFALSLSVEWTQRSIPLRTGDLDDLTANTLGAALGAILALVWKSRLSDGFVLASLWLLWNGSLLLPAINHASLPREGLDAALLWLGCLDAFLGFLVLSSALRARPILMAILAFAPFLGFSTYPSLMLVRFAAAVCALLIVRFAGLSLPRVIGPMCLVALAFQELYPFHWQGPPQSFSWLPFESLFVNRPQTYFPLVLGKLFFYTTVVWSMRAGKVSWRRAFGIPAAVLVAGEAVQLFLPGRTPETTDLALIGAGAFLLWLVEGKAVLSSRR